jgi:endonuclease YncB( thermonuclease family)
MRFLLAALAALVLSSCQPQQGAGVPSCQVSRVTDGDTLHLVCDGSTHRVRLLGLDTPEIFHPGCAAERVAGEAARSALTSMVQAGPVTAVRFQGHDRYGRDLARVSVGGRDLSEAMIAAGHGLVYDGGAHPDWCAQPK